MKVPDIFVPKKNFEKNIERLLNEEVKPSNVYSKYSNLDVNPLLDSENKPVSQTQDRHIVQFNSLGRVMASLADYYEAGKSGSKSLIDSLRKDFSKSWVVGSDRIFYNGDSLDAKIIRYFGGNFIEPVEVSVFIPDYSGGETLDTVLDDEQGVAYVQALFNTTDDEAEVKKTLSVLSGKASSKIRVWTPDQGGRKASPVRAAFLGYNLDYFHIGGGILDDYGRSRGVRFIPR